nr:hypothetical protein [Tanacetum cinerariifolium]
MICTILKDDVDMSENDLRYTRFIIDGTGGLGDVKEKRWVESKGEVYSTSIP